MSKLNYLLFYLLVLLSPTGLKATAHRKDYVAKLAKKPKAGKKTGRINKNTNPYLKQTQNQRLKSKQSHQKLLREHQQKLRDYKANPTKFDNQGHLKNAPNEQMREKRIRGRIKELSDQITKHEKALKKIEKAEENLNPK